MIYMLSACSHKNRLVYKFVKYNYVDIVELAQLCKLFPPPYTHECYHRIGDNTIKVAITMLTAIANNYN